LTDEFSFPRPSDEEVEQRFLELVRNRDLDHDFTGSPSPSLSSRTAKSRGAQRASTQTISAGARATSTLSISTKWQMVEAEARQQWEKRKKQQKQLLADGFRAGRGKKPVEATISRDSPEWFIRKVLDNQLTHQDLVTLGVSLRTFPLK
jgi:cytokinesis protein